MLFSADDSYEPSITTGFNNNLNYDQNITAGYVAYTLAMKIGYCVKAESRYEYTTVSADAGYYEYRGNRVLFISPVQEAINYFSLK